MRERLGSLRSTLSATVGAAVTTTGWTVIGLGVVSGVAGVGGGYVELRLVAVLCALVLLSGAVLLLDRARVETRLELRPPSTVAGRPGRAVLRVTSRGRRPLRHRVVSVPVRRADREDRTLVRLPVLRSGQTHEQQIVLPATERGIVEVGPVGSRRTDPLGLFVRHTRWSGVADLAVRPRTIEIESIAPGHVPDHDGSPSERVSMSDLAFHALREYVPGDDLRHVHWRSSARAGVLHVRQYHDTRRSSVVVVVDRHQAAYPRAQDFELALSIAASVVVRLDEEGYAVTFSCGPDLAAESVDAVLDVSCRAVLGPDDLQESTVAAHRSAPQSSQLVLVSGVHADPARLGACRSVFADDVRFLGLTTGRLPGEALDEPPGEVGQGTLRMARVRRLVELPGVLADGAFADAP
ncbi:DUF58 domain-containing protein [Nocardioides plantarum]|uniref:DUF58 domain-containing protein n=1 Tax=Nocardioides plantarum TaxID=29299 RepID=A0ABV5KDN4_9ACTN|nr:DUF58 domain-containing protein [Nocardioides plantarum]